MVSAFQLKKNVANACILDIVINKFSYRQELSIVILFEVDKYTKIGLYNTVLLLYLAINLKIKSS